MVLRKGAASRKASGAVSLLELPRCSLTPQCVNVLIGQLHEDMLTAHPGPAIALHAADQPLAVVVNLDQ